MKLYFRIIAIIAVLAIIPLQYFLLANFYDSLAENLYSKIDLSFTQSVEEEILVRAEEYQAANETHLEVGKVTSQISHTIVLSLNDKMQSDGIFMDWDSLKEIFSRKLSENGLQELEYKIVLETIDTTNIRSVSDFTRDDSFVKYTWKELSTHVVPVTSDLTSGLRAIVNNPYKLLISNVLILTILSLALSLFVVFCLFRFSNTLGRLSRLSKMRQDHTYSMIHDMRTPLSTITLIAEDLESEESTQNNPQLAEELRILKQESRHINKMCDQIIAVAKLEQKKLKFNYEEIVLSDFFSDMARLYSSVTEKDVDFVLGDWKCGEVIADRLYLTEIVNNLIDNSIKYSRESVQISFSSMLKPKSPGKGKYVEIHLRDNGIGISEDMTKRLFGKFERGENTVGMGGHGMGLHYVYQLMRGFKGYIKIISRLNDYTEVILGFPVEPKY